MPIEDFLDKQKRLSGILQFLHELGHSEPDMSYFSFKPKRYWKRTIEKENSILDTIAVLLTSSHPDDSTAAAFDKNQGIVLILAKNRPPTDDDDRIVRSLISAIMDPSTHSAADLAHFLLSHCREKMQKRISELHQSLSDFYLLPSKRTYFTASISHPFQMSIEKMVPKSVKHFQGKNLVFRDVLRDLFEKSIEESRLELNPADAENSMSRYRQLCHTANILLQSQYLEGLCNLPNRGGVLRWEAALKLRRRLAKVCLYHYGVNGLIKAAKRLFHDDIPFHWVPDSGTSDVLLDEDYLTTLDRSCTYPILPVVSAQLKSKCTDLISNWEARRRVTTTIHAEIRIILYFHHSASRMQRPIGCSRQNCFYCALWITSYNTSFISNWITSGSHGKPRVDWALPDIVNAPIMLGNFKLRSLDQQVLDRASSSLMTTLKNLFFDSNERDLEDSDGSSDEFYQHVI